MQQQNVFNQTLALVSNGPFHAGIKTPPKPALSPFKARRIKQSLILAYCHEQIDAEAVAMAFAVFGELRAA